MPGPNKGTRIWAHSLPVAATLLIVGGEEALNSLQTASVTAGLPVAVILVFSCINLYRALRREYAVKGVEPPWG